MACLIIARKETEESVVRYIDRVSDRISLIEKKQKKKKKRFDIIIFFRLVSVNVNIDLIEVFVVTSDHLSFLCRDDAGGSLSNSIKIVLGINFYRDDSSEFYKNCCQNSSSRQNKQK